METTRTQTQAGTGRPAAELAERILAWALPSLADLVFALCLIGIVFVLQGRVLGQDGDIGWHIRLGLQTLAGSLPRADTFSFTAYGRPLVGMEWLAEVCYAAVWRLGGLTAVVALAGVLVAGTAAGLLVAMRARGTPLLLALPLALAAVALTSIHWVARPHLFSLLLTLWWSEWLWRYWRDGARRRLWYFPPVMLLWVNLHGGFLGGTLLLGTAVAVAWLFPRQCGRAEPGPLSLAFAGTLLATTLTPWGVAWIGYFASYFADPLVSAHTQELQSPDFHTLAGRIFLALLLLLAAAWIFGGRRMQRAGSPDGHSAAGSEAVREALSGTPEPLAWATVCVWTVLAFSAVRAVPLWGLIVTPVLGEALARWMRELADSGPRVAPGWVGRAAGALLARSMRIEKTERQTGRGAWAALAVIVVLAAVAGGGSLPGGQRRTLDAQFSARDFPVAAVAALKRTGLPAGRGFNTVEWGGYLIYALPRYHVFIDSRSDFYGRTLLSDYLTVMDVAPGWQRTLDRYGVRWALLPTAVPLAGALAVAPGWTCAPVGGDGVAVVCQHVVTAGELGVPQT